MTKNTKRILLEVDSEISMVTVKVGGLIKELTRLRALFNYLQQKIEEEEEEEEK